MTDLSAKFTDLESLLTTQHGIIAADLTAILAALGAPPPGDLITLDDISAQLTTLNTNVLAIASDNSAFYSTMTDGFSLLLTNIDTMLNNNSANTQALLSAIYATSCACPTPTAVLPLPIDITPTDLVDEAKCRRIQFYLSVFGSWLTKIANYGSGAGYVTGDVIAALLAAATAEAGIVATGAEVGAVAGPPGLVVGAVVGLIAGAIFTLGASVLVDYATQFNDPILRNSMVMAMFAATNADEGYTAFKTTLLASMSTIPAEIIYTLWWTAWSNDVYSGSPTVDDSAFDGTICTESSECPTAASAAVDFYVNGHFTETRHYAAFDSLSPTDDFTDSFSTHYTWSAPVLHVGTFTDATLTLTAGNGCRIDFVQSGGGTETFLTPSAPTYTFSSINTQWIVDWLQPGYSTNYGDFTVEYCPA